MRRKAQRERGGEKRKLNIDLFTVECLSDRVYMLKIKSVREKKLARFLEDHHFQG